MKNKITPKGSFGYIQNRRKFTALRTILYFALSISLYVAGYVTTGSNRNLLTIVAVLGCLPSCKSAVNFIVFLRAKGCSQELRDAVEKFDTELTSFYDLYFTSYQKNYQVSHMVLKGNVLCGITESEKCDVNEAQKHLEQMLSQEGIKNMTVKIFSDRRKYIDRLGQLVELETEENKNRDEIVNLLYSISLS
jgi:hypothetical protein